MASRLTGMPYSARTCLATDSSTKWLADLAFQQRADPRDAGGIGSLPADALTPADGTGRIGVDRIGRQALRPLSDRECHQPHDRPAGPSAGVSAPAGSGVNATAQPSASPLRDRELAQDRTSSSMPTGLVVLLVALVLAAAAGSATAVMLRRRRRHDRRYDGRYGPAPAPRRPHDDQPTGQFSRTEEMNGPRYR